MADLATLKVTLVANLRKFQAGMKTAGTRVRQFATTVKSSMKAAGAAITRFALNMARSMKDFVVRWLRRAAIAVVAFGVAAVKMAADAEESENLVRESFGDMTDAVVKWSDDLQERLGLNAVELRKQAGFFKLMTESMGLTADQAFELSTNITELAANMASFRNQNFQQMFNKLRSGIVGLSRPLKEIGVDVQEEAIRQLLLRERIDATFSSMTQAQKIMARYILILKATDKDTGDLARTYDTTTNVFRVFGSQVKILGREMGEKLLPMVTESGISMRNWLMDNREDVVEWFGVVVGKFEDFIDFLRVDYQQGFSASLAILAEILQATGQAFIRIFELVWKKIGSDAIPLIIKGIGKGLSKMKEIAAVAGKNIAELVLFPFTRQLVLTEVTNSAVEFGKSMKQIFTELNTDIGNIVNRTLDANNRLALSYNDLKETFEKGFLIPGGIRAGLIIPLPGMARQGQIEEQIERDQKKRVELLEKWTNMLKESAAATSQVNKAAAEEVELAWEHVGKTITDVMRVANESVRDVFAGMLEDMAVEMDNFGEIFRQFMVNLMQEIARMEARLLAAKILGSPETGGAGLGGLFERGLSFLAGGLGKATGFGRGGIAKPVYAAQGFVAKGADTVPAMLSPGEGVLRPEQLDRLVDAVSAPAGPPVNINIHTMDHAAVAQWAHKNKRILAAAAVDSIRTNSPIRRMSGNRRR